MAITVNKHLVQAHVHVHVYLQCEWKLAHTYTVYVKDMIYHHSIAALCMTGCNVEWVKVHAYTCTDLFSGELLKVGLTHSAYSGKLSG